MPKGEAQRLTYKPGQERPRSEPADPGNYSLTLASRGKPGLKGWKTKGPKKFPYRMLQFALAGTEDETTGKEKRVREILSVNPAAFFRTIDLMMACEYPVELDLPQPSKPSDPAVKEVCDAVDAFLDWLEEEELVLRAYIDVEEYRGEDQNRITSWKPKDEEESSEESGEEDEEAEEPTESEDEESEDEDSEDGEDEDEDDESEDEPEDEPEEEKPAKSKAKGKPAPKAKGKKGKK